MGKPGRITRQPPAEPVTSAIEDRQYGAVGFPWAGEFTEKLCHVTCLQSSGHKPLDAVRYLSQLSHHASLKSFLLESATAYTARVS